MSLLAVTIDSREPDWVQRLAFGDSTPVSVGVIEHGDLLAVCDDGALLAVERKTPGDLLASIADGRLFAQVAGMRAQTPWCYVAITGDLTPRNGKIFVDGRETGWTWASVQGALLSVQELGAMIIECEGDREYGPTVIRLSERSHEKSATIKPLKEPTFVSDAEKILAAIPGVGLGRAGTIIDYCQTAGWALTMLTTERHGEHIPGIGPGIKAKIRAALGLKNDQYLSVITDDGNPVRRDNE